LSKVEKNKFTSRNRPVSRRVWLEILMKENQETRDLWFSCTSALTIWAIQPLDGGLLFKISALVKMGRDSLNLYSRQASVNQQPSWKICGNSNNCKQHKIYILKVAILRNVFVYFRHFLGSSLKFLERGVEKCEFSFIMVGKKYKCTPCI